MELYFRNLYWCHTKNYRWVECRTVAITATSIVALNSQSCIEWSIKKKLSLNLADPIFDKTRAFNHRVQDSICNLTEVPNINNVDLSPPSGRAGWIVFNSHIPSNSGRSLVKVCFGIHNSRSLTSTCNVLARGKLSVNVANQYRASYSKGTRQTTSLEVLYHLQALVNDLC